MKAVPRARGPIIIFLALTAALLVSPCSSGANVMIGGAGIISRPSDGTDTYFSQLGFGGGIFFDARAFSIFRWEADALYFQRRFGAGTGSTEYHFQSDFLEFPVLLRLALGEGWSVGGGGYISSFQGPLRVLTSSGETTGSLATSMDWGPLFSLRVGGNSMSPVFAEYRYSLGFRNIAAQGSATYFEVQFLAGFCLGSFFRKGSKSWCY